MKKNAAKTTNADSERERETRELRRQIIFRRVVLDNRPLLLTELKDMLETDFDRDVSLPVIKRDIADLVKVGCQVELQELERKGKARQFQVVFRDGPHTDDDTRRENIAGDQKELVARLAASLICGGFKSEEIVGEIGQVKNPKTPEEKKEERKLKDSEARLVSIVAAEDVKKSLDQISITRATDPMNYSRVRSILKKLREKGINFRGIQPVEDLMTLFGKSNSLLEKRQDELKRKLFSFWTESSRLVAIDSGTTNIRLAKILQKLVIPMVGTSLSSLTVCTNSRRIFEELGPSNVWVKTIIIGGQQKFRSPTIAGAMAEIFLRSVALLQFGICLLGSTRVDLDNYAVCSDSQEESSIKNLLMDRSSLRVICVDDSKLQTGPGREGYKFAAIDPRQIDLILTNCPMRGKDDDKARRGYEMFLAKIWAIESRGVPVLVATSKETFDYPEEITKTVRTAKGKSGRGVSASEVKRGGV